MLFPQRNLSQAVLSGRLGSWHPFSHPGHIQSPCIDDEMDVMGGSEGTRWSLFTVTFDLKNPPEG